VIGKVLNAEIRDSIRDGILNDRVRKHNTGVKVKLFMISFRSSSLILLLKGSTRIVKQTKP
jgi:hypothetical protein